MQTDRDIKEYAIRTIRESGENVDDYDIDAIVTEIGTDNPDEMPYEDFWNLVARHDRGQ